MAILFTNVTAVTMDPAQPVLTDAFVAVEGTRIASVETVRPAGEFDRVIDCAGKVMMPGLVNAHTHVPMTLMRGYGGGCDLHTWLNKYIFPAEAKLDDRCVAAGAALGLAEMIASGTTCIADMYMNTETIAQTVLDAGISANLACGAVYFGDPADFSPEKCNDCGNHIRLYENWHNAGDGQIKVDASIHAEYTSCPRPGSGWRILPKSTAWGCTSTCPRPSPSTRSALINTGPPLPNCWTSTVCGKTAVSPPTASICPAGIRRCSPSGGHRRPQPGVQPETDVRGGPPVLPAGVRHERGPGHRRGGLQQQPQHL